MEKRTLNTPRGGFTVPSRPPQMAERYHEVKEAHFSEKINKYVNTCHQTVIFVLHLVAILMIRFGLYENKATRRKKEEERKENISKTFSKHADFSGSFKTLKQLPCLQFSNY